MPWDDLASNQTISFTNLKDGVDTGVLSQKAAIPTSNEQITKEDANTYVNINTSFAPYAGKANNQLVVKSDLRSAISETTTINLRWYGIANNQTTISPIQLISGENNNGDGRIFRSTDFGVNYSSVLIISDGLWRIKFAPNFRHASYLSVPPFIAVGNGGRIVTNSVTNCSSWVTISSPTTRTLRDCAFNNFGTGIIVGNGRILRTNTANRINSWSIVNSVENAWIAVATDGSNFVAVGDFGSIATSNSLGGTWTLRNMPPSSPSRVVLYDVTYHSDGYFYAVGGDFNSGDAFIMRSGDSGVNWELYNPTNRVLMVSSIFSIISIGNRLVIGGSGFQFQIINNTVVMYNTTLSSRWYSCVKDANSNGFDMAGFVSSTLDFNGVYSNF